MASSRRTTPTVAGTGTTTRPGLGGPDVVTAEDWEAWYRASHVDHRTPAARRRADDRAANSRRLTWRRAATITTGTAAVLAVFSSGVLYADLRRAPIPAAAVAQPVASTAAAPSPAAPSPSKVIVQAPANVPLVAEPVGAVRGAPPVQLSIPALNIDQRLVGLRVKADQQLEVPQSYDDIGWWSTGPVPGDPGAALMVGHLDSKNGPAVFNGLPSLTKGATISVRRADGTRVKFAVNKVQSFPKDDFPDELVYRTEGRASLHLVTCGGTYDASDGYRDNVVVFADLIEPKKATKAKAAKARSTSKGKHSDGQAKSSDKFEADSSRANEVIADAIKKGRTGAAKSKEDQRQGD